MCHHHLAGLVVPPVSCYRSICFVVVGFLHCFFYLRFVALMLLGRTSVSHNQTGTEHKQSLATHADAIMHIGGLTDPGFMNWRQRWEEII